MDKPHAKCDDMRNALSTAMTKAETRVDNPCVNTVSPSFGFGVLLLNNCYGLVQ